MATDQLSEQEIQFRKRARRRLIGAVALVLLMVTVLPMVLDERDSKAPQPEIAISIPSQDGASFSSKIVPTPPASPTVSVSPVTPAQPVAAPVKPATDTSKVVAPKTGATADKVTSDKKQPQAKPEESLSSPIMDEQKSTEEPKPAEEQKSAEAQKPVAPAAKPTPAAKAPQAAPTDKSSAKKGSFSVQLGVLLASANIKPLQAKVVAQGFHSYTESLTTPKGTMIRLRAGPFASRAEAEQAHEKLKAAGLSGIIVTNK